MGYAMTEADTQQPHSSSGSFTGLILILVGILAGALLGLFYGETMWRAAHGPTKAVETLEKTLAQKQQFSQRETDAAASTDDPQVKAKHEKEAQRLSDQAVRVDERLKQVETIAADTEKQRAAGQLYVAETVWMITEFCGDVFLQILKLLVIPLVITSMITGITSLGDVRKVGRVGLYAIGYYFITTTIAVLIGLILVLVIQPGSKSDDTFAYQSESVSAKERGTPVEKLLEVVRGKPGDPGSGMFPANIFQAATSTNVLALIVFAIVFGSALTTIGEEGEIVIRFFRAANEAVMKMVHMVMVIAPVGIFGLVATNIAKNGGAAGFGEQMGRIGWYVAAVAIGLLLHAFVLMVIVWYFGKKNPFRYVAGMSRALLTAVSTASSSATLPITIECVEENNDVSPKAAGFVLPLGATINMDGTALYEAVAVIFIAQSLGIPLGIGELLVIFLTASLAAVGAAGVPEAGLFTMVIVLQAVGLPTEGVGIILAIDWFLDRLRTTVNVFGDSIGAAVVDNLVVSRA